MAYDLIVVGGGIAGLGHAWAAAQLGCSVALFEANPRAVGASIRNFGMVWPIGQPAGEPRKLALRGAALWQQFGEQAEYPVTRCGSLHVAHHDDEWRVLQEFAGSDSAAGLELELLDPRQVQGVSPGIQPAELRGGLLSRSECRVHPPSAIGVFARFLAEQRGVAMHFGTPVVAVQSHSIRLASGESVSADRIVICGGASGSDLFPDARLPQELLSCKLQMLATVPQPSDWQLGPHVAGGLTLRHYPAFRNCPSLEHIRERIRETKPELDRYGIHVMASQAPTGELILGDSHEYGEAISPFDSAEIDALILQELKAIMAVPDWTVARRWNGVYAKRRGWLFGIEEVRPGVRLVNGFGGNGMTLALAVAERHIQHWEQTLNWEVPSEPI